MTWRCSECGESNDDSATKCLCGFGIDALPVDKAGVSQNAAIVRTIMAAFGISLSAHGIGGYFLAPQLTKAFPGAPLLTVAMISSSALSPLAGIIYLMFSTHFFPKLAISKRTVKYVVAGIVLVWITALLSMFMVGKHITLARNILDTPRPYYYVELFLLLGWGPLIEETLYRGYFFQLLRRCWGNGWALVFSSFLFVLFHGIWGGFDIGLIPVFLYSLIFTLFYMEGGLMVAVTLHSFCNAYLLYMNMH